MPELDFQELYSKYSFIENKIDTIVTEMQQVKENLKNCLDKLKNNSHNSLFTNYLDNYEGDINE